MCLNFRLSITGHGLKLPLFRIWALDTRSPIRGKVVFRELSNDEG